MAERTLFYWSKMYNSQIKSGDPYNRLKKCITINILDFECIPLNKMHTSYHITEDGTGYRLSEVLEIHYLELPKLREESIERNENESIVQWMEFIGTKNRRVMEMLAERNNDIKKAYSELQVMSKDEIARMAYEAREAEISDQKTRMETARKEGIKQGKEEGFEEGSMKKAIENAENFLRMGINEEVVAKGTGLTIEKVLEIKGKL